jgi:TRAP-type C4-dicarboxylate transport system permease small subunit
MLTLLRSLAWVNTWILRAMRQVAWSALALMVVVILAQVFFRYVLNNALPWPDEAARFLMLWMTALMAPSAMRWGGFVSIDMLPHALPRVPGLLLSLVLLVAALVVLFVALSQGYNHTFGFGGKFNSSSLRVPLDLIGLESIRVKLKYMYGSLLLCVAMMGVVTAEMILRTIVTLFNPSVELPEDDAPVGIMESE